MKKIYGCLTENRSEGAMPKGSFALKEEESAYEKQGRDALEKALEIIEDKTGWKIEISEVQIKISFLSARC